MHCPESRPQIVRELVSVPHFDQLLQDPYANFVIQAALAATKVPPTLRYPLYENLLSKSCFLVGLILK